MATTKQIDNAEKTPPPLTCGLVMPISAIDGCSAEHWADVKAIIQEAIDTIETPKFTTRLVSDADDIGVIQKRIIQGIYNSDIVVCDVSAKNSNVMFELGMRLAFDRPTIIIKDDKTDYSFDTSIIEHLAYPRDLRFSKIVAFKKQLADKVLATHIAATKNPDHSTFLKNFGTFKVANLDQKEGSSEQLMLEMLSELQREVSQLRRKGIADSRSDPKRAGITEIANVLLRLRMEDNSIEFEPTDRLIDRLLEVKEPNITGGYRTKESFIDALNEACELARAVSR